MRRAHQERPGQEAWPPSWSPKCDHSKCTEFRYGAHFGFVHFSTRMLDFSKKSLQQQPVRKLRPGRVCKRKIKKLEWRSPRLRRVSLKEVVNSSCKCFLELENHWSRSSSVFQASHVKVEEEQFRPA